MKTCLRMLVLAGLFGLLLATVASAQDIQTGVTYVCNGERISIDSCNIFNTSDTSTCMVGHPDTILPNGLMKYTTETRGALKKLLPTCQQPSAAQVKNAKEFNKKIQDQQNAALQKAQQGNPYAAASGPAPAQPPADPQTLQMRRCVAAGRVMATCVGNGLMASLMPNVNGILNSVAPGVVGKEVTGPQMAGVYTGNGAWRLEFSEASVALSCGDMIPDSHAYTISFVNNRAVLDITSTPKDVVLTLDGNTLSGAAPQAVDGRVSLGVSRGTTVQGQPVDVYSYQRVTRNCVKPVLNVSSAPGVVGTEKNLATAIFNDGDSGPPTPAGLRMNGSYAVASGFSVQFFPESVILGCGPEVARAYPYTVAADGKQAAVKVSAPDHPLTLLIKPNNVLDPGTGPYQVEGRRITGQNANGDYTFAPFNATCNLAALSPGSVPSTAVPASNTTNR